MTARLWGQEEGSLELDRCCLCTFDVILEGPILARASVIQIHVGQEPEQGHGCRKQQLPAPDKASNGPRQIEILFFHRLR